MPIQTVIFLILGLVIFVLVLTNVVLFWLFERTRRHFDQILEAGKIKDFKNLFLRQKEKNIQLDKELEKAFLKIKDLEAVCRSAMQKTSVVRFNPFDNMGGNQSFVIAMLDEENNGFIISSLFAKEANRVYAKAIKNGKSKHPLSKEEQEALNKAIKNDKQS